MRSTIRYLVLLIFFCVVCYIGYKSISEIRRRNNLDNKYKTLPEFKLSKIFDSYVNSSDIKTNNSFLIIYFHPDCDYCHYEVEQIILNMDKFSMHQIIMIATATRKSIEEFTLNHYLTEFDNISVLIDTLDQFYEAFGPNSLPTSFIYNKDKNLVKRFEGEVSTEALLEFLNR